MIVDPSERTAADHLLTVRDLSVAIGGVEVVRGLDLDVGPGERVALLGPSGAGKSVTAAAVLGRLPAVARARGSVRLGGVEVLGVPAARRGRVTVDDAPAVRVAAIGQDSRTALNPLVTVGAQLRAAVRTVDGDASDSSDTALAAELAASGLADPVRVLAAHPGELSGGQRQRVALTFALVTRPQLLVADEPTTALDPDTRRTVLDLLDARLAATGAALLFITHDTEAAGELCSRTVHVREGRRADAVTTTDRPRPPAPVAATTPASRTPAATPTTTDRGESVLRARGLHRVHPDPRGSRRSGAPAPVRALQGVDLDLRAGECVGLAGRSGAGKSTLLRLLLALEHPDAGEITAAGRAVGPGRVRALRWFRRLVQYMPQDPAGALDPRMTVGDVVAEPLARLGVPGSHDTAVRAVLDRVELPAAAVDRRPGEISGGQAARVALARALVVRPRLLLADEPLAGLDPQLRDRIVALLAEVCAQDGTGLLLVAHDHDVLARLCPRTVVLADGAVTADGPTAAALVAA